MKDALAPYGYRKNGQPRKRPWTHRGKWIPGKVKRVFIPVSEERYRQALDEVAAVLLEVFSKKRIERD